MADTKISALTAATTPLAGTEVLPVVQSSTTKQVSVANLTAGRAVSMSSGTVSSGNLAFSTTGQRITGDFSNATLANRLSFQSSTTNGNTNINAIPNGTATTSQWVVIGGSDPDNAQRLAISTNGGTDHRLTATYSGTPASGTFLPITMYIGGAQRYTFDTTGNIVPTTAAKGINFSANTPAAGMTSQLLNWYEEGTWTATLSDGTNNATMSATTCRYVRIGRHITVSGYVSITSRGALSGSLRITGLPFTCANANSAYAGGAATYASGLNITAGQSVTVLPEINTTYMALYVWAATGGTTPMQNTQWTDSGAIMFSATYSV